MAGKMYKCLVSLLVFDLNLWSNTIFVIYEHKFSGGNSLEYGVGVIKRNLFLHLSIGKISLPERKYSITKVYTVYTVYVVKNLFGNTYTPNFGHDRISWCRHDLFLLLPIQDEPPAEARLHHLPQVVQGRGGAGVDEEWADLPGIAGGGHQGIQIPNTDQTFERSMMNTSLIPTTQLDWGIGDWGLGLDNRENLRKKWKMYLLTAWRFPQ